jgi:phosphatidylserine/phosphatidylglycerophosphate/cardiolipin synthase-like enzyme
MLRLPTLPLLLAALLACATTAPRPDAPGTDTSGASSAPSTPLGTLELVESFPVETTLDTPGMREAKDVWPEMFAAARQSIDLGEFYLSHREGSALEPSIAALEAAAARGVKVRVLTDAGFAKTYPEVLARLEAGGITVRRWEARADLGGGPLHAKYFVVDGREAFFGSQNFDWRALEHIQELGMRVSVPSVVRALADTFAHDWALAGKEPQLTGQPAAEWAEAQVAGGGGKGGKVRVLPVVSPEAHVPPSARWDLPELVRLIDGAQQTVRVHLLTYKMRSRDGEYFAPLEDALLRAADRGVKVELALADWGKRAGTIEHLQKLHAPARGLTVKLVTIPQHSGGHIPFARVIHAKYLVADGRAGWVGTSNWEKSYFHGSRNVGVVVEGEALAAQLEAFHRTLWESPYAYAVDPGAKYTPPDVAGTEGK